MECDKALAKEIAGSHGVSDTNMMIFLGIIEDKVNQILQLYQAIHAQRSQENHFNTLSQLAQMNEKMMQNKNRADLPTFGKCSVGLNE